MAKASATAAIAEAPPAKRGPSMAVQLGALLLLTGVAAATGWFSGGYLNGEKPASAQGETSAPAAHGAPKGGHGEPGAEGHGEAAVSDTVIPLPQITTNLAAPSDVWLRMELSIVLDTPQDKTLPDLVHQDFLAFVRTVRMHQLEGASGFQHFKADLLERAAIRSGGHVKQVLIRTLLVE